jgi:hypothetical protein
MCTKTSNKQYTLYYVGSIVSVLSATLLLILGLFNVKSVLGDRIVSFINLLLLIAIAVYNSLESHTVPWMGRVEYEFSSQIKGYAPYCSNYNSDNTFKRCCKFFFFFKEKDGKKWGSKEKETGIPIYCII